MYKKIITNRCICSYLILAMFGTACIPIDTPRKSEKQQTQEQPQSNQKSNQRESGKATQDAGESSKASHGTGGSAQTAGVSTSSSPSPETASEASSSQNTTVNQDSAVTGNPAWSSSSDDYSSLSMRAIIARRPRGQVSLPPPGQTAHATSGAWRPAQKRYEPSLPKYSAEVLEGRISPVEVAARGTDRVAHLEAVEKVLKEMSVLENSKNPMAQNSGYYVEHELRRRQLLNDQDLIPELPGVDYTGLKFATPLQRAEGLELRSGMNTVLVVQSSILHECRTAGIGSAEGCGFLGSHLDRMQAGILVADRLSATGNVEQYKQAMGTMRPYLDSLKGFATGFLRQGAILGAGITAAAILPATITSGVAVAALTYVVYEGVKAISESDAGVMGLVKSKWESFISSDLETRWKLVGEVTADVTGLVFGGALTKGAEHMLQKGVGMLLHRTAAREMLLAAEGAGSVLAEWGTQLKKFIDLAPEQASHVLRSAPAEKWTEALPSLSQKSVDGLASLQRVAPDVAESFVKHGAEDALSFGQSLKEIAAGTGTSPDKAIKGMLDSTRHVNPQLGNKYVRELPDLTGTVKEAFEGHIYKGTYEPGEILVQAQRTGQGKPGNWFLPIKPVNAQHAEELANIRKWGNDAGQIKVFKVKEHVSGYAGKIAGGDGHQFFVPNGVPIQEIIEELKF